MKRNEGLFGKETRVLMCADYKPRKPAKAELQVMMVKVDKVSFEELHEIEHKQNGNCLYHGNSFCAPREVYEAVQL